VGADEIAPETFADFDQHGRLLGIEVLNTSQFYSETDLAQLPVERQAVS
jgi:uncharacterized protein YuzE